MSLKDWKNNELRTVLSERWGFSFNLLNESQEEEVVEEAEETLDEEEVVEEAEEVVEEEATEEVVEEATEEVVEEATEEAISEEEELEERRAKGRDREGMEPDSRRRPMSEDKIRRIIRKLVKEAMTKKAK